jgi:hypothetical protein
MTQVEFRSHFKEKSASYGPGNTVLMLHTRQRYGLRQADFTDRNLSWFGGVSLASSRAVPTLTHDAAGFLPLPAYLIVIVGGTCVYCFVDMVFLHIKLCACRIRTEEPP